MIDVLCCDVMKEQSCDVKMEQSCDVIEDVM
jgi:hypothetical protein